MKELVILALATLVACGGSNDPQVELTIDSNPLVVSNSVQLSGTSFVPAGSRCPPWDNPFAPVFGTLGPHEIRYVNAATGRSGSFSEGLWVCNSGEGRTMQWDSNPISLATGDNAITVTMTDGVRTSSATITVRPR